MTSNKLQHAIVSMGLITLIACGQSKEQQAAAEKHKIDSIANAAAQNEKVELLKQQATQDSIKNSNEQKAAEIEGFKNRLVELKGQLATEQAKLEDIKSFQIGRSVSEKEQQIGQQTKVIESLKVQITDLENQISK